MNKQKIPVTPRQEGVILIEALVGVLIFSIGLLALIGLQSVAIREMTEAKTRTDASFIADRVMGDIAATNMSAGALTALAGTYNASTNSAHAWAQAAIDKNSGLPNGEVQLTVNGNTVTVVVSWSTPGGNRTFSQSAQLVDG